RIADERTAIHGAALVLEPTESQNFLLGSSREFDGSDTSIDYQVVETIARLALRFFPKMDDFKMIRTYTRIGPYTKDHLPIVSAVEEVAGVYIAAGHEGDGISLATGSAKLIEVIVNGRPETSLPVDKLRFDRFQKSANA